MANGNQPKGNGAMIALLQMASSGDNWVKLVTLGMIAVSGIGNLIVTENAGADNRRQIEKEIHEVYQALDRNKEEFRQITQDTRESRRLLESLQQKANQ